LKVRSIIDFLPIFSKTVWNFSIPSVQFYRGRELYGIAAKKLGISLTLFHQRAPNVFTGDLFKGSLNLYY